MKITRVVVSHGRYYRSVDLEERKPNGKPKQKWAPLTRVADGDAALLEALKPFSVAPAERPGDFPQALVEYKRETLHLLAAVTKKEYERNYAAVSKAFRRFNLVDVTARDCREWLYGKFATKPTALKHYKARLSSFFSWCVETERLKVNPVREVKVKEPPKRGARMTDEVFLAIRARLPKIGKAFIDLAYLTTQRPTEIRLLRESQVKNGMIEFKPTKTLRSSGASVLWPVSTEIEEALGRARALARVKALPGGDAYVIQTAGGTAFSKTGLHSMWRRACKKASIDGVTTRDIRPFALTTAKRMGYHMEELQVAAAHTSVTTTEGYIRQHEKPVSVVRLKLPRGT